MRLAFRQPLIGGVGYHSFVLHDYPCVGSGVIQAHEARRLSAARIHDMGITRPQAAEATTRLRPLLFAS